MKYKGIRMKAKVHYGYWLTDRIKKYVFVFFLVLSHSVCFGQDIRNGSNVLVGKIEANGVVRDGSNMMIGKIESDGTIRDKHNMLVGKVETNGAVRDRNNMTIGRIEADGTVRDRNHMMMGKIGADGTVRNRDNMTIGYARGVPMAYAAVFLFFGMFGK